MAWLGLNFEVVEGGYQGVGGMEPSPDDREGSFCEL